MISYYIYHIQIYCHIDNCWRDTTSGVYNTRKEARQRKKWFNDNIDNILVNGKYIKPEIRILQVKTTEKVIS